MAFIRQEILSRHIFLYFDTLALVCPGMAADNTTGKARATDSSNIAATVALLLFISIFIPFSIKKFHKICADY